MFSVKSVDVKIIKLKVERFFFEFFFFEGEDLFDKKIERVICLYLNELDCFVLKERNFIR